MYDTNVATHIVHKTSACIKKTKQNKTKVMLLRKQAHTSKNNKKRNTAAAAAAVSNMEKQRNDAPWTFAHRI